MEYDRSLFRVYERVMEDLSSTPSPLERRNTPFPFCYRSRSPLFSYIPSFVRSRNLVGTDSLRAYYNSSNGNYLQVHQTRRALMRLGEQRQLHDRRLQSMESETAGFTETEDEENQREGEIVSSDDSSSASLSNHNDDDAVNDNDANQQSPISIEDSQRRRRNENTQGYTACTQMNLYRTMQVSLVLGIFHLCVLILLHSTYVGPFHTPSCIEHALRTRKDINRDGQPLLGKDELLQVKILYDRRCLVNCSRVRRVVDDPYNYSSTRTLPQNPFEDEEYVESYYSSAKYWQTPHYKFATLEALVYLDESFLWEHNVSIVNVTLSERCLSTGHDAGDKTNVELNFFNRLRESFSAIYGWDTALINQLMYGISLPTGKKSEGKSSSPISQKNYTNGFLENVESKERWNWSQQFLDASDFSKRGLLPWFFSKIGVILMSFISFFLVTSVTTLIVRVLTGSGVVLMFPIFAFFRAVGLSGADDRILGLSYPWIGLPRAAMQQRNLHPESHLVWAHLCKIFLYYLMYEGCQAAWSSILYGKSIPVSMPVWIFGFAMLWEYFSMVFLRSSLSIHFFPRATIIYFTSFHTYFYSVPYGYFNIGLLILFFFMVHAMAFTILALELPASSRGSISIECPREVYNRLSWSEWTGNLPVEWTMFLPLNSRYVPLHDREDEEGENDENYDVNLNLPLRQRTIFEEDLNDNRESHNTEDMSLTSDDDNDTATATSTTDALEITMDNIRNRTGLHVRRTPSFLPAARGN